MSPPLDQTQTRTWADNGDAYADSDAEDESDLLTDDGDYGRTASTSKPTRAAASSRRTSARKPRASARVSAPKRSTRGSASVSATQSASAFSSDTDQLASDDDDDELDDRDLPLLDDDDDDDDQDQDEENGLDGDGDSSNGSEVSGSTGDLYGGRKTARQRAKELGGDDALELMSLPNRASPLVSSLDHLLVDDERESAGLISQSPHT